MSDDTTTETGELVERVRDSLSGCCAECVLFEGKPEDGRHEAWCAYEALSTLQARIEELEQERDAYKDAERVAVDQRQDALKMWQDVERERDALTDERNSLLKDCRYWREKATSLQEARGLLHSLSDAVITWWADQEDEANAEALFAANDAVIPFLSSTKETE